LNQPFINQNNIIINLKRSLTTRHEVGTIQSIK